MFVYLILGALVLVGGTQSYTTGFVVSLTAAVLRPLVNPLKGYCLYTNDGKIHWPYFMVFQYVSWGQFKGDMPLRIGFLGLFGFCWKFEQRFVVVKGFDHDMTA